MRAQIAAGVLVGLSALAFAQSPKEVECKQTETQSECHDRLKCKADEELVDCQKRLLKCRGDEQLADCEKRTGAKTGVGQKQQGQQQPQGQQQQGQQQQGQQQQGQQQQGQREGGDRGRQNENERGSDRGRQNEGNDRGRQNEGNDRGNDRGSDRGSDRRGREDTSGTRIRRSSDPNTHGFEANKKFGLGLELGYPTGLTGKVFVTPSGAIDFGVGYMYNDYYYNDGAGFHAYADFLWHPVSLVHAAAFELPFYVGVGGRFWNFNYCYMGLCDYSGTAVGVRVPIGIAFDFNNTPLDIFIQVVPVLDFLSGDYYMRYGDRVRFNADFSAGIRFWFK
jgi:hypothetical protein